MDVAYYLSELLGQTGKVNMPDLGYFTLLKVDGYYNDAEAKFYPPASKIQFDPQFADDEVLARYIADKKHISIASAKYFTEKFISNLKLEAMTKDVALANMGWIHLQEGRLEFKNAGQPVEEAAHYGFPEIELEKLAGISAYKKQEYYHTDPEPKTEESPEPILQDEPVSNPEAFSPPVEEYFQPQAHIAGPEIHSPEEEAPVHKVETYIPQSFEPESEPEVYVPPVYEHVELIPEPEPEVYVPPVPDAEIYISPVYTPEPTAYTPPAATPQAQPADEEEFIFHGRTYDGPDAEDYTPKKSYKWLWSIVILFIVIAIACVIGLYKYKPSLFKKFVPVKPAPIDLKAALRHDDSVKRAKAAADSVKKDTSKTTVLLDTTAKTVSVPSTSAIDSTKTRYEIMGTSAKTEAQANKMVKNYKIIHIDNPHIVYDAPGRRLQISLGTYTTRAEAIKRREELLKIRGVQRDIYILPINPKK